MRRIFDLTRYRRSYDLAIFALIVLSILLLLYLLPEPDPVEVSGRAGIIDGDSLHVAGHELRLLGIDAPEREQTCERGGRTWSCGAESARQLGRFLAGRRITCRASRRDDHDRLLAVCHAGSVEVNRWLVEQGWAVSYDAYPAAERSARNARRGIWNGTFIRPREWREENR